MRSLTAFFIVVTVCLGIVFIDSTPVRAQQSREQLEQELIDLEAQIKALNGSITQTQAQKNSLAKDISLLTQKINQSKLKIKAHDAAISKLNQNISE